MRKLFLMAFAIAMFMSLGAGSALAAPGGPDKECPPASPVGQEGEGGSAPNCGNGNGGDKGDGGGNGGGNGNACPPNSPNPGGTPPCGKPPTGEPTEPPEGKCESAELVLLTEDARIICLFTDGTKATEEEECEGAFLATGPIPPLNAGVCVFLPPEGTETPALPTP